MNTNTLFYIIIFGFSFQVVSNAQQNPSSYSFLEPDYSFIQMRSNSNTFPIHQQIVSGYSDNPATYKLKSKALAQTFSVTTTLLSYYTIGVLISNDIRYAPAYLLWTGLFLTAPSSGYLYIRNTEEFWYGTGQRAIGLLGMGIGLGFLRLGLEYDDNLAEQENEILLPSLGFLFGSLYYVIKHTISDITDLREDTERYNERIKRNTQIIPFIDPESNAAGLTLRVSF